MYPTTDDDLLLGVIKRLCAEPSLMGGSRLSWPSDDASMVMLGDTWFDVSPEEAAALKRAGDASAT